MVSWDGGTYMSITADLNRVKTRLGPNQRHDTYVGVKERGSQRHFSITPTNIGPGNNVNVEVTSGPVFFFGDLYNAVSGERKPLERIKTSIASPAVFRAPLKIGDSVILNKRGEDSNPDEVAPEEDVVQYDFCGVEGNEALFTIASRRYTID